VVPVLLVDHLAQRRRQALLVVEALLAVDRLHRHHDVDAVGLAAHVLVDPGELHVELLGGVGERAEHAEAAGPAHRRRDVAAMGEGEDRELDAELLAQLVAHGDSVWVGDAYAVARTAMGWSGRSRATVVASVSLTAGAVRRPLIHSTRQWYQTAPTTRSTL